MLISWHRRVNHEESSAPAAIISGVSPVDPRTRLSEPVAHEAIAGSVEGSRVARIARHSPAYTRTTLSLFAAGFATFLLMYCVQPVLPALALDFGVSAAESSLAVSVTTGCLALAMLISGGISDAVGRTPMMVTSIAAGAVLTLVSAVAPTWETLLLARAALGIVLAGLPAVAMTYVGEEMEAHAVGVAMGIYVAGTALGGMVGRLLTSVLTDLTTWRVAVAVSGVMGLASALLAWRTLPASLHFVRRPFSMPSLGRSYVELFRNRALVRLLAQGFLFMGAFMALYNYIGFRLLAPPYAISQSQAGAIFLVYLVGMISSPWAGTVAVRIGRRQTLALNVAIMIAGAILTIPSSFLVIAIGVTALTFGFFGAHSLISSWIGHLAGSDKAQASSLYLFFYYLGASIAGAAAGVFWERWHWTGVAVFLLALLCTTLLLTPADHGSSDRDTFVPIS